MTSQSRLLVIGKQGQLAQEINRLVGSRANCLGRHDLDLLSIDSIKRAVEAYAPAALINASAYTAVDQAEQEKEAAFSLNHDAVANLAKVCKAASIPMVHVSTDYVFKGDKGSPYCTDDERNPQGVYGESKAEGEKALLDILPDTSCVLRTSWVYSAFGNNFVKTMLKLMASRDELTIIDDQIGSPTWAAGLADACVEAATQGYSGIYHWSDEGVASWYDFALAIHEIGLQKGLLNKAIQIRPIPTTDYPTPASRPHYSVLDKTLTRRVFKDSKGRHWRAQLSSMLDQLTTENP